jgi:hypothetical protein
LDEAAEGLVNGRVTIELLRNMLRLITEAFSAMACSHYLTSTAHVDVEPLYEALSDELVASIECYLCEVTKRREEPTI